MRNLLRCRRGSAAFATVAALVPLIGVVALGAEAGSWYVTKQHAQNAADTAAYSGALRVACSISGDGSNCDTAQDYVSRGRQFAAKNGFINGSVKPDGTKQFVDMTIENGSDVRAIVRQDDQPTTGLTSLLGPKKVNIRAQALARVQNPNDLCFLGLGGPSKNETGLTIGGSSTITGNGCGMMSNTDVKYNSTPNFSGPGWAVNATEGCKASAGHCDVGVPHNYNMLPSTNPLHELLDTQSFNTWTGKSNKQNCSGTLTPNNNANLYGDLTCNNSETVIFSPGTYFFYNATITINGGAKVSGTGVTLVLLGNSNLKINGGTVDLSAPTNNATYPALSGVLIDDQATGAVTVNGGGTVKLGGAMYFPNADVSWGGTAKSDFTTCSMVVAKTLTINGNAYLSADRGSGGSGCVDATVAKTQVVALVQ